MRRKAFHLLLFLFFSLFLLSGQDAWVPGTDWRIIRGDRADVIFPAGLENQGRRAAALLDGAGAELARTLNVEKIRRWKLILWYGNSYSGGYVTAGPRYSLWNSGIARESLSGGEWLALMTSHEGRHMAQFDRINQGAGRIFYTLFGDGGTGYLASFCLPSWIFEGDAVLSETLLTDFGRGRSSDFSILMKAHVLEGNPSYSRMVNGSYGKIYPDWYEYGYFLVTYIRKNYGAEALDRIFSRSSLVAIPMLGYTLGIRSVTGKWPYKLFNDMTEELRILFNNQTDLLDETSVEYIDKPAEKQYFSFSNPVILPSEELGVIKNDPDGRKKLNIYSHGGELIKSFNYDHYSGTGISAGGNKIFFSGFSRDPRWSALEYRDICLINIEDGTEQRLTENSRYIYPVPSPDGYRLAAVEFTDEGNERVVILELPSGMMVDSFSPPDSSSPADLFWNSGGEGLIMILRNEKGHALAYLDLATGRWDLLSGFMKGRLEDPLWWEGYILCSSDEEGIRNIYALDPDEDRIFRITSRTYGAAGPAVRGNTLYFIDSAGLNGEALVSMDLDPVKWSELSPEDPDLRIYYFNSILEEDPLLSILDTPFLSGEFPQQDYHIESYSPFKSILNIHSWGVAPEALLQESPELKLGLFSNDILGISSFYGYGSWNFNEKTPGGGLRVRLRPFYPEISFNGLIQGRTQGGAAWTEAGAGAAFALPLDFSFGLKYRYLNLSFGGQYFKYLEGSPESIDGHAPGDGTGYLTGSFSWSSGIRGGYRMFYPLWGLDLVLSGAHNPLDEDYVYTGMSRLSFPGFFPNNSIRLFLGGELRKGSRPSGLDFGRGYPAFQGLRAMSSLLDYDFPILYPDLPLGAVFLRRLRGNFFGQVFYLDGEFYPSAGVAGFLDYVPLNLERLILSVGARFSYRFRDDKYALEIVFSDGS